jgi:hypothetical protein
MHAEVEQFLNETRSYIDWDTADVLEIGAQDVNGSTRSIIGDWYRWTGIDLVEGPGVDYVGDAVPIMATMTETTRRYDVVVSTEVLEHTPNWRGIVNLAGQLVVWGGYLVLTCAGPGRPPHGANGGNVAEGEYYDNVSWKQITAELPGEWEIIRAESVTTWPQDTRVLARKRL